MTTGLEGRSLRAHQAKGIRLKTVMNRVHGLDYHHHGRVSSKCELDGAAFFFLFFFFFGQSRWLLTHLISTSEYVPGHVGSPRSGVEINLVDVPEMNYFSTDKPYPRGEIQVRSAGVFKGYYKDEEKTREAVDPEGWLATGDIGFMDHRGAPPL